MKKIAAIIILMLISILTISSPIYAINDAAITGPSVIYKAANSLLSLSDVFSMYKSNLGAVALGSDGYTGNGSTPGIYEISLNVSNGQAVASRVIEIHVVESLGSIKIRAVSDAGNIHLGVAKEPEDILTHQEIITSLSVLELAPYNAETSSAYLIQDTYTASASTPGTYQFSYRVIDTSGLDNIYDITIYVSDSANLLPPAIDMDGDSGFDIWTLIFWGVLGFIGFSLFKKFGTKHAGLIKPY